MFFGHVREDRVYTAKLCSNIATPASNLNASVTTSIRFSPDKGGNLIRYHLYCALLNLETSSSKKRSCCPPSCFTPGGSPTCLIWYSFAVHGSSIHPMAIRLCKWRNEEFRVPLL